MSGKKYNRSFVSVLFFRPTELQKDKLITPRRLCGMVPLALVSWTTCGAFAVLIIYLQYLFKVQKHFVFVTELNISDALN